MFHPTLTVCRVPQSLLRREKSDFILMLKKSPSEGLFATFQATMLPKVRVVKGLFILNEKYFFA